jgi:hypothetical protein
MMGSQATSSLRSYSAWIALRSNLLDVGDETRQMSLRVSNLADSAATRTQAATAESSAHPPSAYLFRQ